MEPRPIDMARYERKAHFDYFRSLSYPYVGVTVEQDVTEAYRLSKSAGKSFYLTMLHAVALAADRIPELRQRIRGDQIVEYPECPTSHTERTQGEKYCYCTLHHHMDLWEYFARAEEARKTCAANGIAEEEDVESMYFISTVPWLHYTALIQPVAGGDESNPRITWGQYQKTESGRIMMPVSILAHHALVDGSHIARFYDCLGQEIEEFRSVRLEDCGTTLKEQETGR